ncbi:hypothetical protein L204_106127 [Cryptococcus depauperatus]
MALSIKGSRVKLYYLSFASTVYLDFSTEQSPDANAQYVTARDANVSKSTDHSQKVLPDYDRSQAPEFIS